MLLRPADRHGDRARIGDLVEAAAAASGREVLSEHKAIQLAAGIGSAIVGEGPSGDVVVYIHLTPPVDGAVEIETVVHPDVTSVVDWPLLTAAAQDAARPFLGHHWAHLPDHISALEAGGHGLGRRLLQLRRPLPPAQTADVSEGMLVRSFALGDEEAFLAVHLAAFADHPEAALWDRAWLDDRMTAGWFDPGGFLLAVVDQGIAAYCWTKVHEGGVGEIFLIGVDPDHRGTGLGTAISLQGLWHLARAGCVEAMLYADGSNRAGLAMYRQLGFVIAAEDRCYEWV